VLEVAAAHGTKSLQRTYKSTPKFKAPLMPVRGFCFFMDGIPSSADQFSKLLDGTCFNIHEAALPLKGARSGQNAKGKRELEATPERVR